jgi:hypothetical protein
MVRPLSVRSLYLGMGKALEQYLEGKIAEIDRQKDTANLIGRGRFSFDMDSTTYGHLPAWQDLAKQKKSLVKWIWIDAVFLSLFLVGLAGDYWERFAQNWWKAALTLLATSAIFMFLYIILAYYNLFVKFRMVDRQARKLIYQDILYRLNEEKETISA